MCLLLTADEQHISKKPLGFKVQASTHTHLRPAFNNTKEVFSPGQVFQLLKNVQNGCYYVSQIF